MLPHLKLKSIIQQDYMKKNNFQVKNSEMGKKTKQYQFPFKSLNASKSGSAKDKIGTTELHQKQHAQHDSMELCTCRCCIMAQVHQFTWYKRPSFWGELPLLVVHFKVYYSILL